MRPAQFAIVAALSMQDDLPLCGIMKVDGLQENDLHAFRIERHGMRLRSGTTSRFHPSMRQLRPWLSRKIENGMKVPLVRGRPARTTRKGAEGLDRHPQ